MPFYADQMFYSRVLGNYPMGTYSATGTGTAIGVALASNGNITLPNFLRRTQITNGQVTVTTAAAGGFTGGVLSLLNGTNTFATFAVAGGTAGQVVAGTFTASNAIIAAAGAVTGTLVGTCTSAGLLAGGFQVQLEQQELYA